MSRPADRIHARGRFSGKPGLHRIRALCAALGNPQKKLKFVHIAGTNGKGSTAAMLAGVFQEACYRTGLFTSPFLVTFHERIRVDGMMIDDASLARLTDRVEAAERTLTLPADEHIGEFEFVTAMAFLYFVEQNCDIVILETGLGGSFDATNVIDPPEAAVITSISLDHMAVLGSTTGEIARSKAGILKKGSAAICAAGQPADAMEVIYAACPVVQIPESALDAVCDLNGTSFTWQGKRWHTPMIGLHQVQNACTALQTIFVLRNLGWDLPDAAIQHGLEQAVMPGRMEIVCQNPRVIMDGGHNEGGVNAIARTIQTLHFRGNLHLVIGMVADKNVAACTETLKTLSDSIFVTQPGNERAMAAGELAQMLNRQSAVRGIYPASEDAFRAAVQRAAPGDTILICGSLYLVGEAEKYFASDRKG